MAMKVLLVNGSSRKEGCTGAALREVARALQSGAVREGPEPAVPSEPELLAEYDTLFISYHIWWHTASMIVGTFLENYDLTDVDVYPFAQSASMDTEQLENSMEFVRNSAAGAVVHNGLFKRASSINTIDTYLTENGWNDKEG